MSQNSIFDPIISYKAEKSKIFDYLLANKKNILCNASNYGNEPDEEDMGLIAGHAYSMEDYKTVSYRGKKTQLVKLRNPWGEGEWTGDWGDDDLESPDKRKFKHELGRESLLHIAIFEVKFN